MVFLGMDTTKSVAKPIWKTINECKGEVNLELMDVDNDSN